MTLNDYSSSESEYDGEEVEIAIPDRMCNEYDRNDPFLSRLGGKPTWLCRPVDQLKCSVCSTDLFLLLQMDCPLSNNNNMDRVIYIFSCNTKDCVRKSPSNVFRVFFHYKKPTGCAVDQKISANFWEPLNMEEQTGKTKNSPAIVPCNASAPKVFPVVVLKIIDELMAPKRNPRNEEHIQVEAINDEVEDENTEHGFNEEDEFLDEFLDRTCHYPRQCVRYSPGGRPLHFSKHHDKSDALCFKCNSLLTFELQLMPAILSFLPIENEAFLGHISQSTRGRYTPFGDGLEFGTVLVYSCSNCMNDEGSFEGSVRSELESI